MMQHAVDLSSSEWQHQTVEPSVSVTPAESRSETAAQGFYLNWLLTSLCNN